MRMITLVVTVSLALLVAACERKGGNPPKPVTSALTASATIS
ncbi:hypothetical protein [Herbaspirillum sp. LeCh32-8]|nr:hypothetical protein [Herbaspirillum sp. LeCh32-8]